MDDIQNTLLLLFFLVNAFLSLIIFSRGLRSIRNILFALIALTVALWSLSLVGYHGGFLNLNIHWLAYIHSFALTTSVLFFVFSLSFPGRVSNRFFISLPAIAVYVLLLLYLFTTPYIVEEGATTREIEKGYRIGPLYPIYALAVISFFLSSFFFLQRSLQHEKRKIEQQQIKYVLFGSILSASLAIVPNLILPYFGIFRFTWLGPLFTIFIVAAIFIAILRHRLFHIKVIITEVFVGIILIIFAAELFTVTTAEELVLRALLFIVVLLFSVLLVRSVTKEVDARERIEKLAADLRNANTKLHKMNMLKSEFVSVATHQLRSPLTAIRGYTSMLLEGGYGDVPETMKQPLERISRSTKNLVQVVQDFLDVSRIEQGRMEYDMVAFSFKDLVREVVDELEPTIVKSELDFSVEIENEDDNGHYLVRGDRLKIKQVVGNLIDNALKYTEEGYVTVRLFKKGETIRFEVEDSGMGISEKTLKALFKKFNRADDADEVNVTGTGLGLYIAREIIDAHEGKIWAESEGSGKGSTFIVELESNK